MRHRGFTLIELILAVGIIALLMSLVIVGMSHARTAASKARSLNSLRGVIAGYTTYTEDHRGALIPGFMTGQVMDQLRIEAEAPDGADINSGAGYVDGSSWVWRFSPYIDDGWQALYTDYASSALVSKVGVSLGDPFNMYGPETADPTAGEVAVASNPAIGLNATLFGGNMLYGDNDTLARNPWGTALPVVAAVQASEVRNATRALVFCTTREMGDDLIPQDVNGSLPDVIWGSPEVRPPFTMFDPDVANGAGDWVGIQWKFAPNGDLTLNSSAWDRGGGLPVGRWGDADIPSAHFDGSTAIKDLYADLSWREQTDSDLDHINRLRVMRNWSPTAVGRRFD